MIDVPREPMTTDEVLAVLSGRDLKEYRAEKAVRNRIDKKSRKYIGKTPDIWPDIKFNWDTKSTSQRFSLDGYSESTFSQSYPNGFVLGYVKPEELDKILCHQSRRDDGELWEVGCESKLAFLIVYLSEGRPISPPLVKPVINSEVMIAGGHHRYAIAKAINEVEIPIYSDPADRETISKLVTVRWVDA
jgi:hypothetical protein